MEIDANMVEEDEEDSWPRRRTTLIESNNPHLAGGEKTFKHMHVVQSGSEPLRAISKA